MHADTVVRPTFHHFNLKTTRLQELIDWYMTVVGAELTFRDATGAWLTNDAANHRIALLAFPGFVDDPEKDTRTGMHHSAFEYDDFWMAMDTFKDRQQLEEIYAAGHAPWETWHDHRTAASHAFAVAPA